MDLEQRYNLVVRNTEEIVTEEDLRQLLATKDRPRGYIGFEPSGLVHIGWMVCAQKIKNFVEAGFDFVIFFADWHAYINDKLGGDIENIRPAPSTWRTASRRWGFRGTRSRSYCLGPHGRHRLLGEGHAHRQDLQPDPGQACLTIMGRQEDEGEMDSSKTLYPLLQAADIFAMDVDVAYAGMDQRKAHMLAREAADRLKWKKPVAVHTPLLSGLKGGNRMDPVSSKMSKSDPDSGILIHDSPEDIKRKIGKAFCPPGGRGEPGAGDRKICPVRAHRHLVLNRPEKFGGNLEFKSYQELEEAYVAGKLHPMDLKNKVAETLAEVLAPTREYFVRNPKN